MAELPGIGVFGTGTSVKCLVPILKLCGFKVHAIWGRTLDDSEECGRSLDIPFKTSKVDEVLLHKDVDLVFIHCPPHLQSPIAVKALGIGKHVVCGTPAGPSQLESLRMVKAAQYYPCLMSVVCNGLRFLPCFVKMKQLIEDGYIGDPTICEARVHCGSFLKDKFDWMCDELMGGGILNMQGSIIIDLVTFLTGQKATRVHGMLKTFTKQTEKIKGIRQITSDDFCTFQMELENCACVTVTLNNHLPGQDVHELLICGTKGYLVARESHLFGKKQDATTEEIIHKDQMFNSPEYKKLGFPSLAGSSVQLPHLKGMIKLIEAVKDAFECVEEKRGWGKDPVALAASFDDGQYVQTVVDAVRKSSKNREWTKVKIIGEEPDPNMYLSDAMRRGTFSFT